MCPYLWQELETEFTLCSVFINNSYQASLGMSPFEALYGRKCRTLLMWSEVGERALVGPALIKEAEERVAEIRERLKQPSPNRRATRTKRDEK